MNHSINSHIHIIGGLGTHAGIKLLEDILVNTTAETDQDHIAYTYHNLPFIPDRSDYINLKSKDNPGVYLVNYLKNINHLTRLCIVCNTMHHPVTIGPVIEFVEKNNIKLINLISLTEELIQKSNNINHIVTLATCGSYSRLHYKSVKHKFCTLPEEFKLKSHDLIYNKEYGIKTHSYTHNTKLGILMNNLIKDISNDLKFDTLLLGCTEISVVRNLINNRLIQIVDPVVLLARHIIKYIAPLKLKSNLSEVYKLNIMI